jgi:ribonuclease HI
LQLKEAYLFISHTWQELHWAKIIWCADIPPSKSLFVWRLMNDKVPTDENLKFRGCFIPSMCNLCNSHEESSFHLFFDCKFAIRLWSWLAGCLDMTLQFTSLDDIWKLCELNWAPQSKVTLIAAIINLINTIWFVRNQARFNDKIISWRTVISSIITSTSLTGNNTCKPSSNSIRDFIFLKKFNICIHQPKIPTLREILWQPPLQNWLKCNIDGASMGNPGATTCGGVFRDANGDFLYAFAEPLGIENAYFAELCGAMNAIEIAYHKNWLNLWLESDSSLVVAAFKNPSNLVPWPLRNRWKNVQVLVRSLNFIVSHICREGNKVADLFANQGLSLSSLSCWFNPPSFSLDCLLKNKLGLPNFRLCSS